MVRRSVPKAPEKRRGQIVPKGLNKWLVRVFVGSETLGGKRVRKYHSEQVEGTFHQADRRLTQLLNDLDRGSFVAKADQSLGEFLDEWLDTKVDIEEKTLRDYRHRIQKDLRETPLWRTRLDQVTPLMVQRRITDLMKDPRGLSPRTIQYTVSILSQAFTWAVESGMLVKNPCDRVTVPRSTGKAMSFLTPTDVVTLLEANRDTEWYVLWRLLLTTALRPQEAFALKWEDLDGDTLRIQRSIKEDEQGHRYVSEGLKTKGSRRTIPLSPETVEALEAHRKRQNLMIIRRGPKFTRNGFIFANCNGGFLLNTNVRRAWLRALDRAGLPHVRLYTTRHTHLTHLLASGVDVKTVADRAGHSNPVVLLNTYAHVLPEVASAAPLKAEQLLKDVSERRRAQGA